MLKITQHDLKICIKRNFGFEQICAKYQCTKDELVCAIENLYESRNAAKIIKEIQQNTKNIEKAIKKTAKKQYEMRALEESHLTPLEECQDSSTPTPLEQLKAQEATLSATVIKLESEHKALVSQHRSNIKELHQFSERMEAIKRQFQTINSEYEQLMLSNNQLVDQINAVTEQRREQLECLQDIRTQIQSLEIIPVCVYADGRIEALDNADITLDDTGSESLYQNIIHQESEQYQDLCLRDLKTVSRLRAIIQNSSYKFELLFENSALETHCLEFN